MGNETKTNKPDSINQTHLQNQPKDNDSDTSFEEYSDQIVLRAQTIQRVPPDKMRHRLHRFIGALQFTYKNSKQKGNGSGILISPNLVLTCAHNMYNKNDYLQIKTILFYPAQYGLLAKAYESEQYFFPEQFKTRNIPRLDYALIKLKQKVKPSDLTNSEGAATDEQFIKLRYIFLSQHLQQEIALFGYPLSSYKQSSTLAHAEESYQMGLTRTGDAKIHFNKGKVQHYISTQIGQSGSPMISINRYNGREILNIIAIHKAAKIKQDSSSSILNLSKEQIQRRNQQYNVGCLITSDIIEVLELQANRMGVDMFKKVQPIILIGIHKVNYFQVRGKPCEHISRVVLRLDEAKSKTTCFQFRNKIYKPDSSLRLSVEVEAFLSYHDDQQTIQLRLIGQKGLFYILIKSLSQDRWAEQQVLKQLQTYLTQEKRAKMELIAEKCTIDYFKQLNNLIPIFCFTDRYRHLEFTHFLKQLCFPFNQAQLSLNIFWNMTALIIKHSQQLPLYKGTCYYLANYILTNYQIGDQVTIKHFLHCTTNQPSQIVLSQHEECTTLWQIQCQRGRVFYEVSSWPSQNQVTLFPFTILRVIRKFETMLGKKKIKVLYLEQIFGSQD